MNIMIVDDEPQVAEVLAKSLTRQGHKTTVVHSGEDALRIISTAAPDALFLDVSMPGINGLDVLAEVRRTRPQLAGR
jgi:DNA-binding response OmpR family regulator